MHYTQHIQLPQWVESDRIMMDDFNDMTAKIDEGIAAVETDTHTGYPIKDASGKYVIKFDDYSKPSGA